jgi:hypothetical protein
LVELVTRPNIIPIEELERISEGWWNHCDSCDAILDESKPVCSDVRPEPA